MKRSTKLFGVAALAAGLCYHDRQIQITEYRVQSQKIPRAFDGYKILQLSDLHSRSFGMNNCTLLEAIRCASPDIVVMTGDMVNRTDTDFEGFYKLAKALAHRYPVYSIVGNHEQRLGTRTQKIMAETLKASGVTVLNNEKAMLVKKGESINLYGLWCDLCYYRIDETAQTHYYNKSMVENALGSCEGGYRILLAHNPLFFPAYANWGADLTLSGHVHGGGVRLPLVGGLLSPERKFFPKYSAGEYRYKGKSMIVSRGLGDFRICNPPDIPVITLNTTNGSRKNP